MKLQLDRRNRRTMMREGFGGHIEGWGGDMLPIKDDIDGGSAFIGDGGTTF